MAAGGAVIGLHVKMKIFAVAVCIALAGAVLFWRFSAAHSARWYSPEQARAGRILYDAHCLSCHGANGAGDANWRVRGADGAFPPPPLNGTAHTWHHNLAVLRRTIKRGGIPFGGKMPAFGEILDAEESDSVIAYIQSLWSEETYQIWKEQVQNRAAR